MTEMHTTIVQDVSHSFVVQGKPLEVLKSLSFQVGAGEVLALIGPSGCGKSTLLRCIAGLQEYDAGNVLINGRPPKSALKERAIGFAFQESALLSWRTVEENILLPLELGHDRRTLRVKAHGIDRLLNLTRLEGFRGYMPDQLSGGMKQRVSLARALLMEPDVLLLDEPFGSLDLLTRTALGEELSRIVATTSVPTIVVTHSIEEAVFLGSRVVVLSGLPARILEVVPVPLPFPRTVGVLGDRQFLNLVTKCRSMLLRGAGR